MDSRMWGNSGRRVGKAGAGPVNRLRMGFLAGVSICGGLWFVSNAIPRAASAKDTAPAEGEFGTVIGQFVLEGEIPARKVLVAIGAAVNDRAICAAADLNSDELLVDPATRGIANIFV